MRFLSWPSTCGVLLIFLWPTDARGQAGGYVGAGEPTTASAVYGQGVRETAWQSPAEEQAGFHLPPGFQIELFACEPQIAKPLNIAWDARGRLWVTSSREYPYPATADSQPRDTLKILEDTNGDGRADQSTTFAEGLNIPIGVLPVSQGAICFSIPNLWLLRDTDGDDRADERIKLLGPFDTSRDTHGMVNSLSRGHDGWIYACHGFNNQSDVTAADGSRVQLTSGNTFRFREDGSRIEQVTQGQVNPFGMTRDEWGNWYSADCHSKPLTALLPGACYPSFSRPHDGLGFAPPMMDHLHGSTAICGLQSYQAEQFPIAYRKHFYSGNVMTSRINCNALEWQGSTAVARELPDFLTSDDPWFRPVDIQLGPDGALYVADFYNKIIGHYEVPLDHPERDRESGRIWKISYVGDEEKQPELANANSFHKNLLEIDASNLPRELASKNATRRRLAIEIARAEEKLNSDIAQSILSNNQQADSIRVGCLEILFRRGRFELTHFRPLSDDTTQPHLLVHQLSLAAELPLEQRKKFAGLVRAEFPYQHPQVNRAACRLLGLAGEPSEDIIRLARFAGDAGDPALTHTARIALKYLMSRDEQLTTTLAKVAGSEQELLLANILPAIDSELSAGLLVDHVAAHPNSTKRLVTAATRLATKYASDDLIDRLLAILDQSHADDLDALTTHLESVCESYLSQHIELPTALRQYGSRLQAQLWQQLVKQQLNNGPRVSWSDATGSDWSVEKRNSVGAKEVMLRSSLTRGESFTGQLISQVFRCPQELRFMIAGHNGPPDQSDAEQNRVELRLFSTGETLRTASPPRSDVAAEVDWQLDQYLGQFVSLVVTDGDAGKAYAWLAVGEFSQEALNASKDRDGFESYLTLARRGFTSLRAESLKGLRLSSSDRARLISAGLLGAGSTSASELVLQAVKLRRPEIVDEKLLTNNALSDLYPLAKQLSLTATLGEQRELVRDLVRSADGCRLLKQLLEEGALSSRSCRQAEMLWPSSLDTPTREFLNSQFALAAASDSAETTSVARFAGMDWNVGDRATGQQLYQQHCAACHQLRGAGAVVGPQLDGAVVRGIERLFEDIVAPNLNVDRAFRVSAVLLDDDSVLSGLLREDPDGSVVISGQDGKSQQFPGSRIRERRETTQSLMPANFGELLNDQQLASLMAYLIYHE